MLFADNVTITGQATGVNTVNYNMGTCSVSVRSHGSSSTMSSCFCGHIHAVDISICLMYSQSLLGVMARCWQAKYPGNIGR